MPTRVFGQRFLVWRAVAQQVRELQAAGRPVLISTDSLADAQALNAVLTKTGLNSHLLHGRQDGIEHSAMARAGRPLRVTIAVQLAGQGTHIELAPGLGEIGGLHVICCSFSGVRRVQFQMLGRAGRRGQAGSGEVLLCLDQGLLARHLPRSIQKFARRLATKQGQVPPVFAACLDWYAQRAEEFVHRWTLWKLRREDRSWKRRGETATADT
jgi:preprotein translocase subunit SecA